MSEIEPGRNDAADSSHSAVGHFLWRQLPYIVALVLAIAGVAYTNASRQPLVGYWELALAIGVVCVITKWPEIDGREARWRLIWTQALHWIAVLVMMNIMLVSGVQQLLPTPASSLVLLVLLIPCRRQPSFAANRLPRPRDGPCGSRDFLAEAICHALPAGRHVADRPWHHVLA
jgi:hypothetical protein